MANFIPEEKISEIKNASDIVDVISESVLLKKAGRNHLGLCPFHSEKTPSFTVSSEKQIFYCFGCGAGGNIYSFLMKHFGISFPEVVKMLGKRCGIEIDTHEMTDQQRRMLQERERLFDLNAKTMAFYRESLEGPAGQKAREYLKRRGLTEKIISDYHIGFVPDGWDHLVKFFKTLGISRRAAEGSGLVLPNKRGGYYDRFRNRIMFPIRDVTLQVVGFGGRVMDDSLPKYMNSPETPIYNKSKSLYGLSLAKGKCRQSGVVYIVEGYFDCISLARHGIENVVATLGTSLTPDHVRMLKGYAEKMVLVYDSDEAGVKAAMRSISVFVKESADARIIVLPSGYDPDSYVCEHGPAAFLETVSGALSFIPFLMEQALKKHGRSVEGKLRIIDDLKEPLAAVSDGVARSLYIRELAERTGIEESAVLERINLYSRERRRVENRGHAQGGGLLEENSLGGLDRMEQKIIAMMLQFSEVLPEIIEKNVLNYFNNSFLKSIGLLIARGVKRQQNVSDIMAAAETDEQRHLMASLAIGEGSWVEKRCTALIEQFLSVRRRAEDKSLLERIKAAENSNNQELLMELLKLKKNQISNRC